MTTTDPSVTDFALDEMPGARMHDVLRTAREVGPIVPTRFLGLEAHLVAGHEALEEALQDEETFPGHRMYQASFEPAIGPSFISEPDPGSHLRTRKLTTPAFRSRAVSRFSEEGIAPLANELLDALEGRRTFDLVAEFTARFPYLVITRLLGLPREREAEFHEWALALLTFRDDPARALAARGALSEFLAPVVEARRREPREDVISELVTSEIDGRRLDDEEVYCHVRLLFPTGGETTHGALGNLAYALLTHEGEWARLADDPDRIPRAVAEGLRWETPIAVLPRLSASHPTHFRDKLLPADTWVLFAIAGANRDPDVFPVPDRFDPDREQPPNLVFGRGRKSCPGMHLARRNMEIALRELTRRLPDLALEDEAEDVPRRTVLRSPNALRVRRRG